METPQTNRDSPFVLLCAGSNLFKQIEASDQGLFNKFSALNVFNETQFDLFFPRLKVMITWSNILITDESVLAVSGFKSEKIKDQLAKIGSCEQLASILGNDDHYFGFVEKEFFHQIDSESSAKIARDDISLVVSSSVNDNSLFLLHSSGDLSIYDLNSSQIQRIRNPTLFSDCCSGAEHLLLLAENGDVWAHGMDSKGQLGQGRVEVEPTKEPVLVSEIAGLRMAAISCGKWHSVAVSEAGDVLTWGWNRDGQLGLGDLEVQLCLTPTLIEISLGLSIKQVACGSRHTAAVSEDGQLFTWGNNAHGQLGHGDVVTRHSPTPVAGIGSCRRVFAGAWNTVIVVHADGVDEKLK